MVRFADSFKRRAQLVAEAARGELELGFPLQLVAHGPLEQGRAEASARRSGDHRTALLAPAEAEVAVAHAPGHVDAPTRRTERAVLHGIRGELVQQQAD